ncbi:hypothetical protein JCM3774_006226 [Rhodotorula dairenensis]
MVSGSGAPAATGSSTALKRPAPYKLSALLRGHEDDVRCVTADRSSRLASASRDGSARFWTPVTTPAGTLEWQQACVWRQGHEGFVNAVAFLPPINGQGSGYVATAGADSLVQVYDLSDRLSSPTVTRAPAPSPSYTLLGHAHNVCALDVSDDGKRIASASWDMTARVWTWVGGEEGWNCSAVLVDHGAAVWDVLLLKRDRDLLLTACADSRIRLFDTKGGGTISTFKGHTGPVRSLSKLVPEDPDSALFASASNDGYILSSCAYTSSSDLAEPSSICRNIIVWNYLTGASLTTLGSHDSFIYSLATLPSASGGGLASSGEDGLIKVWNEEDGELDQELMVPALSVWSLAALPNGDIACGCSDNLIWVFSRCPERAASEATIAEYDNLVAARKATKTSPEGEPVVHGEEVLDQDGKADEVKLVRRGSKTCAYQWRDGRWSELGEMVRPVGSDPRTGGPEATGASAKMQYEGVDYDYVFSIDVRDDAPPLPLPYNDGDDVNQLASTFVQTHGLPASYVDRITEFVYATVKSSGQQPMH